VLTYLIGDKGLRFEPLDWLRDVQVPGLGVFQDRRRIAGGEIPGRVEDGASRGSGSAAARRFHRIADASGDAPTGSGGRRSPTFRFSQSEC